MPLFGEFRHDSIVNPQSLTITSTDRERVALRGPRSSGPFAGGIAETGADEIKDQFQVFQFSAQEEGPRILDPSEVEPVIQGSSDKPDVRTKLQLAAFHVGANEEVDARTRATLRIDFGKDEASNSHLDTVFWSIASGLKLYDQVKNEKTAPKQLEANFDKAFANRPIEIPGGLGRLSFEVVKHREPKWWQKLFGFLKSDTGELLTSTIGFPGITTQAVDFVDELLNRLDKNEPEVLFKSRPLTLALSEKARNEFTGGIPGVHMGCLNPGFALLARGRDFATVKEADPIYMAAYGRLKPNGVTIEDFLRGRYADPFENVTYAVIRVLSQEDQLSFDLRF